jgi:hypothetical protein
MPSGPEISQRNLSYPESSVSREGDGYRLQEFHPQPEGRLFSVLAARKMKGYVVQVSELSVGKNMKPGLPHGL